MPAMSSIKQNFYQVDNLIKNISQDQGAVLLSSVQAWQKYAWSRKLFVKKPREGYFLWLKKTQEKPLSSCISLESVGASQDLINLVVLEKGVKAEVLSVCNALAENLKGKHYGVSKIFLKEKSELSVFHQHSWGKEDKVKSAIDFYLDSEAKIKYVYHNFQPAKELTIKNRIFLKPKAKADFLLAAEAKKSFLSIKEELFLKSKEASGSLILRLVAREKSVIKAVSQIQAQASSRGHLDCQGLLVGKQAKIDLIPQLINENKQALLTHEASIGRIEKEKLEYLQSRGLSEKQAIDLIIRGFLSKNGK